MLGRLTLGEALQWIVVLALLLVVGTVLFAHARAAGAALPAGAVVALIVVGVPALLLVLVLRSGFGGKVLASILGHWIYDEARAGGCCGVRVLIGLALLVVLALLLF